MRSLDYFIESMVDICVTWEEIPPWIPPPTEMEPTSIFWPRTRRNVRGIIQDIKDDLNSVISEDP